MLTVPKRTLAISPAGLPFVVLELDPEGHELIMEGDKVAAVGRAAAHAGVTVGMTKAQALALDQSARATVRDIFLERRWLDKFIPFFEKVTPTVGVCQGDIVLPIASMVRYFGSEDAVLEALEPILLEMARTNPSVRFQRGVADSVFAAKLAARTSTVVPQGDSLQFLAALEVDAVLPAGIAAACKEVGIRTLAGFQRLSKGAVGARFGRQGLSWHTLCRLETDISSTPLTRDDNPAVSIDLDNSMSVDHLVFGLVGPIGTLVSELSDQGKAVMKFTVVLEDGTGSLFERSFESRQGFSIQEIGNRIRWYESIGRSSRNPLTRATLRIDKCGPLPVRQLTFSGDASRHQQTVQVLYQMMAVFGDHAVTVPVRRPGRSPRERGQWEVWSGNWPNATFAPSIEPWPGKLFGMPPTRIFVKPVSVELASEAGKRVGVNEAGLIEPEPAWLVIGTDRYRVLKLAGPWVVREKHWNSCSRRYLRIGVCIETGCYLLIREKGEWQLEASFD
jgi:protein ImuB